MLEAASCCEENPCSRPGRLVKSRMLNSREILEENHLESKTPVI